MIDALRADKFLITPHPKAPLLSSAKDGQLYLKQLLSEASSPNPQFTEEIRELFRQAGFVNLYFFLKGILAYAGPYGDLNETLHLDMCNFRQSPACMAPGAKSAVFVSRGFFKTSINTTGGLTWEINRNPNIQARIVNAIAGRADGFRMTVQQNFCMNEFFAYLYPDMVPRDGVRRDAKNNEEVFVHSSRTRILSQPTLSSGGATGASEGIHVDLLCLDDLLGLDDLDAGYMIGALGMQKEKWFKTNTRTLLINWVTSRVTLAATLYNEEDLYHNQILKKNTKKIFGFRDPDMLEYERPDLQETAEQFAWNVYYRAPVENGVESFPEGGFTEAAINQLIEDDPWTGMAQYKNKPKQSGLSEFVQYPVGQCSSFFDKELNDFVILKRNSDLFDYVDAGEPAEAYLSECDVVISTDFAAGQKGMDAKLCRTSIGVWALDAFDNAYRIWSRVGQFPLDVAFDAVFEAADMFKGHIVRTLIEANGMQKGIYQLIQKEQLRRNIYLNPIPVCPQGDKIARIRGTLGIWLAKGKVWVTEKAGKEFIEEKNTFPMAKFRMDVLDESEKALCFLRKPATRDEIDREWEEVDRYRTQTSENVVGY